MNEEIRNKLVSLKDTCFLLGNDLLKIQSNLKASVDEMQDIIKGIENIYRRQEKEVDRLKQVKLESR